jgi:hypothetical protein
MPHSHNLVPTGLVWYIPSLFFLRTMRDCTLGYTGSKPCLQTQVSFVIPLPLHFLLLFMFLGK